MSDQNQRACAQDDDLPELTLEDRAKIDAAWRTSSGRIRDGRFTQQAPHSARQQPAFE